MPSMEGHEGPEAKIRHDLIRAHFRKIDASDAIYVANYDKNGVKGYVGGNSFLEMGKAYDKGIPIFLMNDIPGASYKDEITAMQPKVIGTDWRRLK